MTPSRPFRLYAESELLTAAKALEPIVRRWAADWFPTVRPSAVIVRDCGAQDHRLERESSWASYGKSINGPVQFLISKRPMLLKAVAAAIAGDMAQLEPVRLPLSPVLANVVGEAFSGLAACIAQDQDVSPQPDATNEGFDEIRAPGSGALYCEFSLMDCTVSLILSAQLAARYVPPKVAAVKQSGLLTLSKAVADRKLGARLVLGHSELALSELLQLDEGDVILLDRHVEQPFDLCTLDGMVLSEVHIGKKGQHIAASIIRKA